jgi:hypothetical protein
MAAVRGRAISRYGLHVLLVAAVYATTVGHGFVWDDHLIIVNNPILEKPGNILRLFLSEDTAIGFTGYYRPITYVSFALDRALWGLGPTGFKITNLILHVLVALLFYATVATVFKKERLALVAALILALHPVAGETVNFLAGGRNTLLAACFMLLSLFLYVKERPIPAVLCVILASFSKEFALLLPLVLLWYDHRLRERTIRFRA